MFLAGLQEAESEVGCEKRDQAGGKGPLLFSLPALWVLTAAEGAEQARMAKCGRSCEIARAGRAGARGAASRSRSALAPSAQRWAEGPSARRPECGALTPELAAALQSAESLGESGFPHMLPSPRVPVGSPLSLGRSRALS